MQAPGRSTNSVTITRGGLVKIDRDRGAFRVGVPAAMMTVPTLCSQTMRQKASMVDGRGACVTMKSRLPVSEARGAEEQYCQARQRKQVSGTGFDQAVKASGPWILT